jgi:hypothetical protein
MLRDLRSVVIAMSVCFGLSAGAQGQVKLGADGTIQVTDGKKKVEIGGGKVTVKKDNKTVDTEGGKVTAEKGGKKVEIQGAQVQAEDDAEDSDQGEVAVGSVIEVNGSGSTRTIRCGPKGQLEINGSGHHLTVTGECESVEVNGTGNTVSVEATAVLDVNGVGNAVTWKRGVGAAKPKVSRTGLNNTVSQEK